MPEAHAAQGFRDGVFYLLVIIDLPTPPPIEPEGVLGVDLGIVEIATDSEGNSYSGEVVKAYRRKIRRFRGLLQSKGTKSAKRHLKRIAKKQSRYIRDINHQISKKIVETALYLILPHPLVTADGAGVRP